APASYPNATQIEGEDAIVGAQAFSDPKKATFNMKSSLSENWLPE
ncbi:MAG: hypothetical protein H6Q43_3052, partial [Deltaproteobacteria bacterium]|nr:hypothetical protein [Deltaproteobacteria bacterium]